MTRKPTLFLLLLILFTAASCTRTTYDHNGHGNHQVTGDTISLVPVDTNVIDSLNEICMDACIRMMTPTYAAYNLKSFGRGDTWKLWRRIHKQCMRSDLSRRPLYFGVANPVGAGGIIIIDGNGINSSMEFPYDAFSKEDIEKIFNRGTSSTSCDFDKGIKVDLEFMINAQIISDKLDLGLRTIISSGKRYRAKIDSWKMNLVNIDMLSYLINRSEHDDVNAYKQALMKANRFLVSKEYVINGFSATIETRTEIRGDLEAKLRDGIRVGMGDLDNTVIFSYENNRTIKVTTEGEFIVFVDIYTIPDLEITVSSSPIS